MFDGLLFQAHGFYKKCAHRTDGYDTVYLQKKQLFMRAHMRDLDILSPARSTIWYFFCVCYK